MAKHILDDLRLVNRMKLQCPKCGYNIRFTSKLGINLDITLEFIVFTIGFLIGGMVR